MEKLLYFDYSAFLLELVLICSIVMRKMYSNKVNRFFLILVTITLFTTAMDIAAVALDRNGEGFVVMKYIFIRSTCSCTYSLPSFTLSTSCCSRICGTGRPTNTGRSLFFLLR